MMGPERERGTARTRLELWVPKLHLMNWAGAGDSAFSSRGFLARGLTAGAAVSYIALTKGGSPMGVAGFVDFSAIAGTFGAVLLVLGVFVSGWAGSLTLLMEGRETQAAWLCGSGGFVPGALCFWVWGHSDEGTLAVF